MAYMSSSSMVMVISLSMMTDTFWRLFSSLWRQKRVRLDNHGVMYSKHRCCNNYQRCLNT